MESFGVSNQGHGSLSDGKNPNHPNRISRYISNFYHLFNYQIRGLLVMECQLPNIVAACPSPLGYVDVLPHGQTLTPNGAGPKPASEFRILGVEPRIDRDISGSKDQKLN